MKKLVTGTLLSYAGSLAGALLFVVGINVIIVPHGLYSGTLTGVAQMIESLLVTFFSIRIPEGYNLTGTILLVLNIPLLIIVQKVTNKSFPVKSIINIVFMTMSMSFIPIPEIPVISDRLTASIVGGAIAGFGAGFTLRCGGSGGGSDLIGVYLSIKRPNFTVGRVTLFIGAIVYTYCLIRFDLNTVVYSAIFTVVYSLTLDLAHYQNIKTSAFIFTTNPDIIQPIMERFGRGATHWEGEGAYSGQHNHIFITVVSKYEVPQLKRIVSDADKSAFIILNHKVDVSGGFIKKL